MAREGTAGTPERPLAVAIIGAGFGGLGMAYYLRQAGVDSFTVFEKGQDVGGVWRENTYPGAACDVPSHLYSFSFESRYPWSKRFAPQAEILEYMRHCARKYALYPRIRFGCEVVSADFDEQRGLWSIGLANGERHTAQVLISSVGQLHRPAYPKIAGLETFKGKTFHSADWDHGYDLKGKSVAVIGTGASAVQFVPAIVKDVKRLYLFQRSAGWVGPKFKAEFSLLEKILLKRLPVLHDLDRARIFGIAEALAYAYLGHPWAERLVTLLSKAQLRYQVRNPALRRKLTPDYPIGCKRLLLTAEWLPALTQGNVEVVTGEIRNVTARGVRAADGNLRQVDAIIFGTGFAATDFLAPMQVRGLGGRDLRTEWRHGAEAYLGTAVAGFPNFFTLYGPNTNLGSGSIIYMLECQQRYIVQLLQARAAQGWSYAEVTAEAQAAYNREIRDRSRGSTFEGGCHSWYTTADGRNTNNWIGSMREFRRRTARPRLEDFRLVTLQSAKAPLQTA
ncbi:MAG: NAD(P)/FAD-dependent oxidoreductase [Nevskia sp.]|nr:NAD(P)/FAD-dependent oxidoreductase [Nevskia sp.]